LIRVLSQIPKKQVCLGDFILRCLWLTAIWLCGSVALAHAAGTPPADHSPVGRWYMGHHDAVIEISPCGADLCGKIVGIITDHPGDPMPNDWLGRPQCGMTMLQLGHAPDPDRGQMAWSGTVTDPRDGNAYRASVRRDNTQHLRLHGYVGLPIFGMTQVWDPYSGPVPADCRLNPK
jgi:uncharacterized protein (DUF2147 family)